MNLTNLPSLVLPTKLSVLTVLMLMFCSKVHSEVKEASTNSKPVEEKPAAVQLESLKKKALQLNRELFILEEDLLFPASTQIGVYLSMDVGEFFQLDSVELKLA